MKKLTDNDVKALKAGLPIYAGRAASLRYIVWDSTPWYVMNGATGQHKLSARDTDLDRLQAHWEGFVSNQGAAA